MNKTIIACVGDLHVNSTVALSHPRFTLDDGGSYSASKPQRWIWHKWLNFWSDVKDTKDNLKANLVVVLNGELADDLNHHSTQLVTHNTTDQMRHSILVLRPALDIADAIIVTRGTEAHSGPSACLDEKIAEDIGAYQDPESGHFSWWNFYGEAGGIIIDVAHHAGSSYRRPSTAGGASNRIAADLTYLYGVKRRAKFPHIAWRGHTHRRGDSANNHPIRVIVNPSWQLTNAFGHKLAGGGIATLPVGGTYAICNNDGTYQIIERFYEWEPMRTLHKISFSPKTN